MSADLSSLMLAAMAGLSGGWLWVSRWSRLRHCLDTPTSKIRSAAQGYVELAGRLETLPDAHLSGPLTGTPCLWWHYRIEQQVSNGNSKRWTVVEQGTSEAVLRLSDGTGECLIDPRGAQVLPACRDIWTGDRRHPLGVAHRAGFLDWLSLGPRYRYTEERLHDDEPLYAIGNFRTAGAQGFDADAARGQVIRAWKTDFAGLLQRFDTDGNGLLDTGEWSRVQLAAQLEAEDRQRQTAHNPPIHHMTRPDGVQPFVLSSLGEASLVRRLRWQAYGGALLCLSGFLTLAYQLGIRHW